MALYAHTPSPEDPANSWHLLEDHLREVAKIAAETASAFGAGDLAWWAGILHDAGKASEAFQRYLRLCYEQPDQKHQTVDHKGAGAARAQTAVAGPLAFVIQGHHGGLPGAGSLATKTKEWKKLERAREIELALAAFEALVGKPTLAERPSPIVPAFASANRLSGEFFLRMLFSALVDADHADTERHFTPEQHAERGQTPSVAELWERLERDQRKLAGALGVSAASPVNRVRGEVYEACLKAAELSQGFFRLTVPTGGGKTRSGLAFALKHANCHGLHRVVAAVPYLTITDQTASVYRGALGDDRAVLEHHSGVITSDDDLGTQTPNELWRRLSAQDWNAPVIVTTTVQLFESLLGRAPSAVRKLHRLNGSVIVLDEAQSLPPHLRGPIFDVLRELVANYRVSVVLCTATQPALDTLERELDPLIHIREIAPDPPRLFRALERVRYEWPARDASWTWERAADEMRSSDQALAVLNTIGDALALHDALSDPDAFHLSTLMCAVHRRDVLSKIRQRLHDGRACRLVSTQVVEAGVDIDFPLVIRALGPLDRIAQAAGRCNREGKLADLGRVVVFRPTDGGVPPGAYKTATGETSALLNEGPPDLNDPEIFLRFFRRLYGMLPADREGIQSLRSKLEFEEVTARFRLIDDDSAPVIVRYAGIGEDDHRERIERVVADLRRVSPGGAREVFRQAQPYFVNVPRRKLERYVQSGMAVELAAGCWEWLGAYDERRGLNDGRLDPALLYLG